MTIEAISSPSLPVEADPLLREYAAAAAAEYSALAQEAQDAAMLASVPSEERKDWQKRLAATSDVRGKIAIVAACPEWYSLNLAHGVLTEPSAEAANATRQRTLASLTRLAIDMGYAITPEFGEVRASALEVMAPGVGLASVTQSIAKLDNQAPTIGIRERQFVLVGSPVKHDVAEDSLERRIIMPVSVSYTLSRRK